MSLPIRELARIPEGQSVRGLGRSAQWCAGDQLEALRFYLPDSVEVVGEWRENAYQGLVALGDYNVLSSRLEDLEKASRGATSNTPPAKCSNPVPAYALPAVCPFCRRSFLRLGPETGLSKFHEVFCRDDAEREGATETGEAKSCGRRVGIAHAWQVARGEMQFDGAAIDFHERRERRERGEA